ncbi:MAG TPA: creatininase family protein [Chloroflexota bacterium]|nr:creatininase family protein [Chloroflexota bacterium]
MPLKVLLADMTREQIRAIAPETTVILPTAAIEQHGPHLTISTDTLACTTICQRAAEIAGSQTPVTVAPPVHFGSSHHHFPYPGVLSLSNTTFIQVVKEICESLVASGFQRIVIVNGHGGNDEAIRVAARDVTLARPVSIAAASYWTIAGPALIEEGLVESVGALPGHAGAFETSLVLALRPDLVDTASYPAALGRPPLRADLTHRPSVIKAGQSLGSGPGYTDNPANASAAHGERFLAIISREVARFLVNFAGS